MANTNNENRHQGGLEDQIPTPGNSIKWLEQMIEVIEKHGIVKIIQALLAILLAGLLIYGLINPTRIFELYDNFKNESHYELIEQRKNNTPKIQTACNELRELTNADRVLFLEFHNNTGNISGLPFYYASASCESIDIGIRPVAEYYLEVKLSLVPFISHLFNVGFWSGDISEMESIDRSLSYKMTSNEVHHSEMMIVEGAEKPCGILIVSFQKNPEKEEKHDCSLVKMHMEKYARKIALLSEVKKGKKK